MKQQTPTDSARMPSKFICNAILAFAGSHEGDLRFQATGFALIRTGFERDYDLGVRRKQCHDKLLLYCKQKTVLWVTCSTAMCIMPPITCQHASMVCILLTFASWETRRASRRRCAGLPAGKQLVSEASVMQQMDRGIGAAQVQLLA